MQEKVRGTTVQWFLFKTIWMCNKDCTLFLGNELVGASKRGIFGVVIQSFFAIGIVIFSLIAFHIQGCFPFNHNIPSCSPVLDINYECTAPLYWAVDNLFLAGKAITRAISRGCPYNGHSLSLVTIYGAKKSQF